MTRVLIVGAGPAGATLAYLLSRRDVEVTVLERHTDFAREFRGEVLMPSGLEPFEQMGLWDALESVPHVTLEAIELYVNGRRKLRAVLSPEIFGRFAPRWTSQPALLEMLVAEAGKHPRFHLERGTTARSLLEERGRFVGVRALSDGGEREIRADLIIGADGRASVVRKRAELPERRDRTPMDVVWCKVPLPPFLERDHPLRVYVGRGHLLIAAPVHDGNLQMAWVIRKGSFGELRSRGMDECLEEMARHVSPDLAGHLREHRRGAIEPFLLWTVSDRVTQWTRPGLLVIGDAAHTMSPVGGQGLNIAIRDAIVAANHLVPALTGRATPEAIDSATGRVQQERLPEVAEIQRLQAIPPRILFHDTWWSRLALWILPLLARSDVARGRGGTVVRRFAFGATEVRLAV